MRYRLLVLIVIYIHCVHYSIANELHDLYSQQIFDDACDINDYAQTSPTSSLPDEVTPTTELPSEANIRKWYNIGLKDCISHYINYSLAYEDEITSPPILATYPSSRNTRCRGNALFYRVTGLLVWPFGPWEYCPTHSQCWFGLLTCGQFNYSTLHGLYSNAHFEEERRKIIKAFTENTTTSRGVPIPTESGQLPHFPNISDFPLTPLPPFKGWSLHALHVYTRVVGIETVVPRLYSMHLYPTSDVSSSAHKTTNSHHRQPTSILIGKYTLTIPGKYSLQIKLQGLYPGMLYDWSLPRIQEGRQAMHSIFLGGSEPRCQAYANCGPFTLPECEEAAHVGPQSFLPVTSTYSHNRCRNNVWLQPAAASPLSRSALPYCSSGNHPGRWIRLPESITAKCGAQQFVDQFLAEQLAQKMRGGRRVFAPLQRIVSEYALHTETLDVDKLWEDVGGWSGSGGGDGGKETLVTNKHKGKKTNSRHHSSSTRAVKKSRLDNESSGGISAGTASPLLLSGHTTGHPLDGVLINTSIDEMVYLITLRRF